MYFKILLHFPKISMCLTREAMCFVSVCHVVKIGHLNATLATKEPDTEFFPEAVGSKTKVMNEESRFRSIKFSNMYLEAQKKIRFTVGNISFILR